MEGPQLDAEMDFGFEIAHLPKAETKVHRALSKIRNWTNHSEPLGRKWRARATRLEERIKDQNLIVYAVAQWMTVKPVKPDKPVAPAKPVAKPFDGIDDNREEIDQLIETVSGLQKSFAARASALRFLPTNHAGREVEIQADNASMELQDALSALMRAKDAVRVLSEVLPENTAGRGGIVGALVSASADQALALKLAQLWQVWGLSLDGGNDGDGLDIILASLLCDIPGKKALEAVRKNVKQNL
jgi:hypothetical protein